MKPTYSITEVINLLASIDNRKDLNDFCSLLQEEKKRYPLVQVKAMAVLIEAKFRTV